MQYFDQIKMELSDLCLKSPQLIIFLSNQDLDCSNARGTHWYQHRQWYQ